MFRVQRRSQHKRSKTLNISDKNRLSKIALCCIAKEEERYIEEWIEYHLALGFDKIIIYDNNKDPRILPKLLNHRSFFNKVEIIHYAGSYMQSAAYNNFLKRYQGKGIFEYVAFFDVDEFLVLHKHTNVKQLAKEYLVGNHGSLVINWRLFGTNGHKTYQDKPVIERFTRRAKLIGAQTKFIAKLDLIRNIHQSAHHCNLIRGYISINSDKIKIDDKVNWHLGTSPRRSNVVQLNHYITKSRQESIERAMRGRATSRTSRPVEKFIGNKFNQVEDLAALKFWREKVKPKSGPMKSAKKINTLKG